MLMLETLQKILFSSLRGGGMLFKSPEKKHFRKKNWTKNVRPEKSFLTKRGQLTINFGKHYFEVKKRLRG
jgi:hypothetical protein